MREFDLVVGADGLHSRVRELVFGPDQRFEKYLGYKVAAFEAEGYRPRDELVYVMYTQVGQQVGRFAMRGDRTMFLFILADEDVAGPNDIETQKGQLRKRFGNSGWECTQILDALASCNDGQNQREAFPRLRTHSSTQYDPAGVPERAAMAISGHRTHAIFDRFHIVSEDDLRTAVKKTNAYLRIASKQQSITAFPAQKKTAAK